MEYLDMICHAIPSCNVMALLDIILHKMTWHGLTYDLKCHGMRWRDMTRHEMTRHVIALHDGMTWFYMTWLDITWHENLFWHHRWEWINVLKCGKNTTVTFRFGNFKVIFSCKVFGFGCMTTAITLELSRLNWKRNSPEKISIRCRPIW